MKIIEFICKQLTTCFRIMEEEPSSEEEPYYLSPEEIRSSLFNFLVTGPFLMFYLSMLPLGLFRSLFMNLMIILLFFAIVIISLYLENEEREKIKIIRPTPTNMENSDPLLEQELLFNILMIGSILLFYLLWFPWVMFRSWFTVYMILVLYGILEPEKFDSEEESSEKDGIFDPEEEPPSEEDGIFDPEEEPSEKGESYYQYMETTGVMINFLLRGSFFMLYMSRLPLVSLRRLCNFLLYGFASLAILIFITLIEKEEKEEKEKKSKIISPTLTYMEFSDPCLEQEPCQQSSEEGVVTYLFNFLMIGSILLFYLWWWFPLVGLFGGLCNFLMVGCFSLSIMMILIVADSKELSWVLSNRIDKDTRKPGDHIYTWRGGYAHHGICAKDGNIIHFVRGAGQGYGTETGLVPFNSNSSPSHSKDNPMKVCTSCGDQSNAKGVISSCIECFLSHGDLYLFQYFVTPAFFFAKVRGGTCTLVPSGPPEEVLNRAKALLGANFGVYHILRNNCESFAYFCKTGLPFFSGQVVSLAAAAAVFLAQLLLGSTRSAVLAVAEGFTAYCGCRYVIERGSIIQPLKVPVENLALWWAWDFVLMILFSYLWR